MSLTVVTYGGGEILHNVFSAIAMLVNGQSNNIIRPLMLITASIGAVLVISKAIFSGSIQSLLSHYLLPVVAIVGLLMVPSATVHIEDVIKDKFYKVSHVPFFLARFSELVSSIGYQTTRAIESVMHVPNDSSYNSTGMIFGAVIRFIINRWLISSSLAFCIPVNA